MSNYGLYDYYQQYNKHWEIACLVTGKQSNASYLVHNGINAPILPYYNWNGASLSGDNTHAPPHFQN